MRPWLWFCGFFLVVIAVLIGSVRLVILTRGWLTDVGQSATELGVVGDMFGAANALFSGMAFVGLIVVLVYEMRERERDLSDRRESRRPVLGVSFEDGDSTSAVTQATITRAKADGDHGVDLRVELTVVIESLGDVALSPSLKLRLSAPGEKDWTGEEVIGLPIVRAGQRPVNVVVLLHGKRGKVFLEAMRSSPGVRVHISVSYRSVSEVEWQTSVEADLRIALEDEGFVAKVLTNDGHVAKGVDGSIASALKTDVSPDVSTWQHGRADELGR